MALNQIPFRITGASNYYLGFVEEPVIQSVLDAAEGMRLNVLRIWAFCESKNNPPLPGEVYYHYWNSDKQAPDYHDGPDGLDRLDLAIHLAGQRGIRLILTLTNNWADFGGMPQYVKWFGLSSKDQFYRDDRCRAAYWQWVRQLLYRENKFTGRRYLDEPAILAWELTNEARCETNDGVDVLLSWITEMSSRIKADDPNHLVAVGDEGFFNGVYGVNCEDILAIGTVDLGTFHLYPWMAKGGDLRDFGSMWIREHVAAGQRANKPMLLEEYGVVMGQSGIPDAAARNALYASWLDQVDQSGGCGDLLWMLGLPTGPGQPYAPDGFVISSSEEAPTIREHAT